MHSCAFCDKPIEKLSKSQREGIRRRDKAYCPGECSRKGRIKTMTKKESVKNTQPDKIITRGITGITSLRLPNRLIDEIDKHVKRLPMRISRNAWIEYLIKKELNLVS